MVSLSYNNSMFFLLRHPKVCKYFTNFRRSTFWESCAYLHGPDTQTDDTNISELEQEICYVTAKISEIDTILLKLSKLKPKSALWKNYLRNREEIGEVKNKLNQKNFWTWRSEEILIPKLLYPKRDIALFLQYFSLMASKHKDSCPYPT